MSSFKSESNELSTSVQHVFAMLDTSTNVLMNEIKRQFAELQKENQMLKADNVMLSREVGDLRERMRNLEQYSRVNNIEISGVPATRNEDISVLVADVGAAIGVEVREMDIGAAHLVPSFRKDREPSVIVQFKTRGTKEQWIEKSRQKKNLTARDVNQHFPVQRIFINDHLSPENKQSLARLKQKGRELSYKFVWCRDGKFFIGKVRENR
ncbi:uncharacterized protein LOC124368255 [Homalodisca vitripennis]|uniref:uncharacterized protein LOC124368255 n=1 Tax=Homalodisca vitripennis TaxID=197043 RepID=UPI001EEB518E|nr:uncharacterized protein LOC124368255 [Homalodisca vitripennis]